MKDKIFNAVKIFYKNDILPYFKIRTLRNIIAFLVFVIFLLINFWLSTHLIATSIIYLLVFFTTLIIGLKWGKSNLNLIETAYLKNVNIVIIVVIWFDLLIAVIKRDEITTGQFWFVLMAVLLFAFAILFPLSIVLAYAGKMKKKLEAKKQTIEVSLASKLELDDKDGMIEDYDNLLKIDPNYAVGYFYRGNIKLELDNKLEARLDFIKAYELGLWGEYYNSPPQYIIELFADENLGTPIYNYDRWY